jgi:uncharacterized protein YbjT (DUF2867 family)
MNNPKKNALIVGSSGLIGNHLLQMLLVDSSYAKVFSLVRKASGFNHPHLEEIVLDFNKIDEFSSQFQVEDVYCCLGTTMKKAGSKEAFKKVDLIFPVKIAEWAKNHGSKQFFLVSAVGASARSGIFYNQVKGELEEYLKKMHFEALHIFQPSLLLGDRKEKRLGEDLSKLVFPVISQFFVGKWSKYKSIDGKQVAAAMLGKSKEGAKGNHTWHYKEMIKY